MRSPRPGQSYLKSRTGAPLPPFRERMQALRLVPRFLAMVWRTRPSHALGILVCRVLAAFGPVALLWVGKLIVDGIVANTGAPEPQWRPLLELVALELGIVVAMEALRRTASLLEGL